MLKRFGLRLFPTEVGSTSSLANRLLRRLPHQTAYLEIGVASGKTLVRVDAGRRVGVDPNPEPFTPPDRCTLHRVPSTEYFCQTASEEGPFSVVFVDGLHLWEACLEDILGAFEHLERTGFVIVDDVYPPGIDEAVRAETFEEAARTAENAGRSITSWMGDVWRAIFLLANANVPGLHWVTVPITHDRYHTVFWLSRGGKFPDSLRSHVSELQMLSAESASVAEIGDFSRRGMAKWYRYRPYWQFMLLLRFREFQQSVFGARSR